jgi:hypothetical protein
VTVSTSVGKSQSVIVEEALDYYYSTISTVEPSTDYSQHWFRQVYLTK